MPIVNLVAIIQKWAEKRFNADFKCIYPDGNPQEDGLQFTTGTTHDTSTCCIGSPQIEGHYPVFLDAPPSGVMSLPIVTFATKYTRTFSLGLQCHQTRNSKWSINLPIHITLGYERSSSRESGFTNQETYSTEETRSVTFGGGTQFSVEPNKTYSLNYTIYGTPRRISFTRDIFIEGNVVVELHHRTKSTSLSFALPQKKPCFKHSFPIDKVISEAIKYNIDDVAHFCVEDGKVCFKQEGYYDTKDFAFSVTRDEVSLLPSFYRRFNPDYQLTETSSRRPVPILEQRVLNRLRVAKAKKSIYKQMSFTVDLRKIANPQTCRYITVNRNINQLIEYHLGYIPSFRTIRTLQCHLETSNLSTTPKKCVHKDLAKLIGKIGFLRSHSSTRIPGPTKHDFRKYRTKGSALFEHSEIGMYSLLERKRPRESDDATLDSPKFKKPKF